MRFKPDIFYGILWGLSPLGLALVFAVMLGELKLPNKELLTLNIPDLSPFIQTFFGAVSGAGAAFAFQNHTEKRKDIEEKKALVNYSLMSLYCNLELLISLKKQIVLPLSEETKRIKSIPGMSSFLETGVSPENFATERLKYLIQTNGKPVFLSLPNLEKLICFSQKNSNVLRVCQRVIEALAEIQETIERQNQNIHAFVDSDSSSIQLLSLLLSLSEGLEALTDNALFFIMRSGSLFNKISDETFPDKRKEIVSFNILEKDKYLLPPSDFIKGY